MRRIATIVTASTVALLALGGTAFALGADGSAAPAAVPISTTAPLSTTAPISTTTPLSTGAPHPIPAAATAAGTAPVGSARAAAIAVERVGGGQVTEVERELEHGRVEWEVEVVRGTVEHDIHVDDATGAVVRDTSGPLHDVDDDDHNGYDD